MAQRADHRHWHEMVHIATESGDFLDDARAEVGVFFGGHEEDRFDVRLEPGVVPGDILEQCVARQFALRRFEQQQASLHDVFVHIVGSAETAQ